MRYGLLLQTLHVAWSACLSVCWAHGWAVQKQLNQLRCHLGADSCEPKYPYVRWVFRSLPLQEWALLRGVGGMCQPILTYLHMSALYIVCLPPWVNVFSLLRQWMNASATARCDKMAMGPLNICCSCPQLGQVSQREALDNWMASCFQLVVSKNCYGQFDTRIFIAVFTFSTVLMILSHWLVLLVFF